MKIVISPAKSLDFNTKIPVSDYTIPVFSSEICEINSVLREFSPKELSSLMSISDKLAHLNWERNQEFSPSFTLSNSRPAIYTFDGDVYTGLDAYTITEEKVYQLQDSLRILSGLYGILKPLDLIQPYRLEMGTKLSIGENKNLYEFWQAKITEQLNKELFEDELFINLASQEYFNAIDTKTLVAKTIVTPIFKDWKNDKLKVISFYAKKARGMMVRYIIDKNAKTLDDIKGFNYDGYSYSEKDTKKQNEPVFVR